MKSVRLMFSVALIAIATAAFAQTDAQKSDVQKTNNQKTDAQKSFEQLKSLAGTWEGSVTMDAKLHEHANANNNGVPEKLQVSLRVTSRGNALVHEMGDVKWNDDPTKHDHPITMFYLDNGQLLLTHYCDAGNRPRMTARVSEDGKKIEFDFLDVSGSTKYGHMQHAVFNIIDANHHTEEWSYQLPDGKTMGGQLDLHRVQTQQASAR
ncbi:MAG TPA: hypothetical protein VFT65_16015 [Candidatus Angelobacter sp.]|nr:hypothetical protein [Candidatus Angelobacter sp.]